MSHGHRRRAIAIATGTFHPYRGGSRRVAYCARCHTMLSQFPSLYTPDRADDA